MILTLFLYPGESAVTIRYYKSIYVYYPAKPRLALFSFVRYLSFIYPDCVLTIIIAVLFRQILLWWGIMLFPV